MCLAVFFLLRLYNSLWRFASFNELARSLGATAITCVFHWVGMNAFVCRMPVAYYVIGALGQFLMVTAIRFAYRFIRLLSASRRKNARAVHNAMIIGAGAAGQAVLRELKTSEAADAVPRCLGMNGRSTLSPISGGCLAVNNGIAHCRCDAKR